jgi:hypothetical protein
MARLTWKKKKRSDSHEEEEENPGEKALFYLCEFFVKKFKRR